VNKLTWELVRSAATVFEAPAPIVEIGSCRYDLPEQDWDLRKLFAGRSYIGCDIQAGPGVDRIEDITNLTFKDGEVGTLICVHILEHVWDVFSSFKHIRRVIKEGGMAIILCPFNLHIHRFPKDYWRFTDDCMRKLMEGFPWLIVGRHGYDHMPEEVFGIGFNRATFPDFDLRVEKFREMLKREAYDASTLGERLRMWVGSGLFKKKNFQTFLRRNDLVLDLVRPSAP
jgi:SAM-dependent methyltransferase